MRVAYYILMPKVRFASTQDPDLFYIVQKRIADPFFLVDTGAKKYVFLNVLEIDAFKEHNTNPNLEAVVLDDLIRKSRNLQLPNTSPLNKLALTLFQEYELLHKQVTVSKHFPLDLADFLRSQGANLTVTDQFMPERRRKTSEEIAHIREAVRQTYTAFELIETVLRQSVIKGDTLEYEGEVLTSEYLRQEVELHLFKQGLESPEGLIISCGPHAAMPHHGGTGPIRPHQTIVCDIFPRDRVSGYFADITRTFVKGTPSVKAIAMYEAVKSAQMEATKAVKPGIAASEVHAVAADIIKAAGFDTGDKSLPAGRQGFIHGLGHGVGLEVHESPSVSPYSNDTLEEGDIITVEPGLYYPEWGGVRLEDVVAVTLNGYENLTNYPRNFIIP